MKRPEEATTDLRERTADTFLTDLGSVALALESSDLHITEDNFVPTARCIQDTKERQLVTRSGLQRLPCCVCHLHHEQAMKTPYRVQKFNTTRLMSVLEMPMRQHTSTTRGKRTKICTTPRLPSC